MSFFKMIKRLKQGNVVVETEEQKKPLEHIWKWIKLMPKLKRIMRLKLLVSGRLTFIYD
ncbi:MAG TPA: hypothetical protein PK110_11895 [Niabella sp.]|nr:hypothetical protein [Niabella sp.]